MFRIEENTGKIFTLREFDRESQESYAIKVFAHDNAPISKTGEKSFSIKIADKNDNPPKFKQSLYEAKNIPENTNINTQVAEVEATDPDSESTIEYSIVDGNVDDSFYIEKNTGKIRVNKSLDHKKITEYSLTVKASDSIFEDFTTVKVFITDINDNPPKFSPIMDPEFEEETLVEGNITPLCE